MGVRLRHVNSHLSKLVLDAHEQGLVLDVLRFSLDRVAHGRLALKAKSIQDLEPPVTTLEYSETEFGPKSASNPPHENRIALNQHLYKIFPQSVHRLA
jgi:hypothetical protein